jgi:hypothetical protein
MCHRGLYTAFKQDLVLLKSCLQTCMTHTIAECTVNKLLMMDRRTVQNMWSFKTKKICEIGASSWFYYIEICYHTALSHESRKMEEMIITHQQMHCYLSYCKKFFTLKRIKAPTCFDP